MQGTAGINGNVLLEVRADVAQPLGQTRSGWTEAGRALTTLSLAASFVVNGGQRLVHTDLLGGELATSGSASLHLGEGVLCVLAENQTPAFELFFVQGGSHYRSSKL